MIDEMRMRTERLNQLEEPDRQWDEVLMNLAEQLTELNAYIKHLQK